MVRLYTVNYSWQTDLGKFKLVYVNVFASYSEVQNIARGSFLKKAV